MPRPRRVHVPGGLHHAVLRGNHRQPIFDCAHDYLDFEALLAEALARYDASALAYCWMTNHVHLAIRVGEAPLGAVMANVASRYARRRQRAVPTTGHLFERRYRARLIDTDRYLLVLVRYIHLNPVRAGMVDDPRDYDWSSHRAYLDDGGPGWLTTAPVLGLLGATDDAARVAYRRLMGEAPGETDRDAVSVSLKAGRPRRTAGAPVPRPATGAESRIAAAPTLDALTAAMAARLGVSVEQILSRGRSAQVVRARAELARRAIAAGAATLSEVARHLGRSPSTVSDLLRRHRPVDET